MQVSYNGFTGELVKLERVPEDVTVDVTVYPRPNYQKVWCYDLSIYDAEKKVTHSFTGVKLEDLKFLDVVVTFGG